MPDQEDGQRRGSYGRRPKSRRFVSLIKKFDHEAKHRRIEGDHREATNKALVRYTCRLGWATWAIAGAGFLALIAALLQWDALRSADNTTREAFTAIQR